MGLYSKYVLPHVIKLAMGQKHIADQRAKVVPWAEGCVLEIGLGAGHNLAFYDPDKVSRVLALEPSEEMRRLAQPAVDSAPVEVEWITEPAETIPLEAASVDTVLTTFTLCTVGDTAQALGAMRRVLKPGGKLVFCEHGKAPEEAVRRWQNRINPLWKRIGGGCNLNRDIPALLEQAGFRIEGLETGYLPDAPRILAYNYAGTALVR